MKVWLSRACCQPPGGGANLTASHGGPWVLGLVDSVDGVGPGLSLDGLGPRLAECSESYGSWHCWWSRCDDKC